VCTDSSAGSYPSQVEQQQLMRTAIDGCFGYLERISSAPARRGRGPRDAVEQVEAKDNAARTRIFHDVGERSWTVDSLQTDDN
jgi:hypothetical protein